MKMSKKYFGFAGAIWIAGMLWAPAVRAQIVAPHFGSRAGMMRGGGGMMLPMLLRSANLTADQKPQVRQFMANHRAAFRDLFNQLRAVQQDMSTKLFSTGAVQEADLMADNQQIAALRSQLAQEGLKVVLEIRNILTTDQLTSVAQRYQQLQSVREQMRNMWGTQQPTQ